MSASRRPRRPKAPLLPAQRLLNTFYEVLDCLEKVTAGLCTVGRPLTDDEKDAFSTGVEAGLRECAAIEAELARLGGAR